MNEQQKLALALCAVMCLGLALVGYGCGVANGRLSLGFVIFGGFISWAALRIMDNVNGGGRNP